LPPKYLAVVKQRWTRKMLENVIAYAEICGIYVNFCMCGIIFSYAILEMPLYAEKYTICEFWQNMQLHIRI